MNRVRILLLAAAFAAALLAAYVWTGMLPEPAPAPAPVVVEKKETVDVLVSGRNIAPGERLGSNSLQWRAWPSEGLAPEMITQNVMPDALEKMQSARARFAMVAGEPILETRIVQTGDSGFVSAILPEGMVAFAVPITELSSVSGFVLPNDRVDVVFTRTATDQNGDKAALSEAVVTNVKVIAINQTLASGTNEVTIPDGRTAVLEVTRKQAEVIGKLLAAGQVSLALRSVADAGTGQPQLAEAYQNPARGRSGPLVVRYGLERRLPGL